MQMYIFYSLMIAQQHTTEVFRPVLSYVEPDSQFHLFLSGWRSEEHTSELQSQR